MLLLFFCCCAWGLDVSSLIEELCVCVECEHACGGKRGGGMLPPARGKLSVSFIQELATIVSGVEFAAGVNEQLCAKRPLSVCRFLQCWNSF